MSLRSRTFALVALVAALGTLPVRVAHADTEHVVTKGSTLSGIAKKYGVTVVDLRRANRLKKGAPILVGQKLRIPGAEPAPAPAPADSPYAPRRSASQGGPTGATHPLGKDWVEALPPTWTQVQKSVAERGGVNPCDTKNPGLGIYTPWSRAPSMGQMVMPRSGGIAKDGGFDVMFHFHGHEPVRKEWVRVMDGAVLVGIDLGISSTPYRATFDNPMAFERLVESVEKAMAEHTGNPKAHVRRVGLSAWSAGYGAIDAILGRPYGRKLVDTLVVLDGMHTGYVGDKVKSIGLQRFIDFARDATRGKKLMFVSHSSIITDGYASSTETAHHLVHALGGKPIRTGPRSNDPMGLELIERYSRGNLHVRGYSGNDKMDHCAHIGLFRDVLGAHVKRRWRSPKGSGGPPSAVAKTRHQSGGGRAPRAR